jgi:succinate-acetate transporter protein
MSDPTTSTSPSQDGHVPQATRIVLRPIANPFALGLMGLAVASVIASGVELAWIPGSERHAAAVLIIAFAPALQLIASWLGFLARDAVAATAMGVMSGTWLCVGLSLLQSTPGSHSHALALLLFTSSAGILVSATTAAQNKLVPALVLLLAGARFALTGLSEWGEGTVWGHASAWTGVAVAASALYGALSLEVEDINHRTILPTLRRGGGRRALAGTGLEAQVEHVTTEAGVRSQL